MAEKNGWCVMSAYFRAVTSIHCVRSDGRAVVDIDVQYGPLVTEERRADLLVKACQVREPERVHRKQEVVYDYEAQPRDHMAA